MVPSAQTATLPEDDMNRHDEYSVAHYHLRSPPRYAEHHPREGPYRHYTSPHLHAKYDPQESYPFILPSQHPSDSHFGSSTEPKILHHTPNSYLSPTFDNSSASCQSPHSHPVATQEPRFCSSETFNQYPSFRMSHAALDHENLSHRVEYNSPTFPHHHQFYSLPLLAHRSDTHVPYATDAPSSDYYRPPIHVLPHQYYAPSGRAFGSCDAHANPMTGTIGVHSAPVQANSDRPFKCPTCPAGFNRNHDLKRHTRIHLSVKPFPCGWCEKSFSRKDALKRHLLVKGCAGPEKVSVDESIRRAEEAKPAKNCDVEPPSFTLPFSAPADLPHGTQMPEESSHSPTDESAFLPRSSVSEESQLTIGSLDSTTPRFDNMERRHSRASDDSGKFIERFTPYARPPHYHHRSQPNVLSYGRDTWSSSDVKPSVYQNLSTSNAVLPPPKALELRSTSSISSLLDGPDYGPEFRAAYSCENRSSTSSLCSHPSTSAGYAPTTGFSSEEYGRSLHHSTPRSSTSDSICSSSTMTTSNPNIKSESPISISQQQHSPSPPLTPAITANFHDSRSMSTSDGTFPQTTSPTDYSLHIKREENSRSPTPQEVPCISSIRCRTD